MQFEIRSHFSGEKVRLIGREIRHMSIPGSYDKNAYKLCEEKSKIHPKPLYMKVTGEVALWKIFFKHNIHKN
jgi:hypothetical protein